MFQSLPETQGIIFCKVSYARCGVPTQLFQTGTIRLSGARGSVVGCGTMLQVRRSLVRFPMRSQDFSIDLILTVAL
jgi:hypothetical protein